MRASFGFSGSICSSALARSASASSWVHSALYRRTCFPLIWAVKPQALRLVRWPGIFHSRWLTCAIGYSSVVRCSLQPRHCEDCRRLCKKAGPSQQASLGERDPVVGTVANDDMIVNRKIEQLARFYKLAREPDILPTRRRVTARMVVNEHERGSALPQRWAEDLSWVNERGVQRAN